MIGNKLIDRFRGVNKTPPKKNSITKTVKSQLRKSGEHYSLDRILELKATYNMVLGERSNGKTFAALLYGLKRYVENREQMALVRRWKEDLTGARGTQQFEGIVAEGYVETLTKGEWDSIYHRGQRWYLARTGENGKKEIADEPFCFGFSLSAMEHSKSASYPRVTSIVFDEMTTKQMYFTDEFVIFMNLISTLVRARSDVKIFMLGNTVDKRCPYFKEMGLTHILKMEAGTIDVYSYGDSGLTVAVERTSSTVGGKKSDKYFAFDNPKLQMITGGAWELDLYPHCPAKYLPKEVVFRYFIIFDGETLECEIVSTIDGLNFTFIHPTRKEPTETDVCYVTEYSPNAYKRRGLLHPIDGVGRKIATYFNSQRVFYSDNETGELVRAYIRAMG